MGLWGWLRTRKVRALFADSGTDDCERHVKGCPFRGDATRRKNGHQRQWPMEIEKRNVTSINGLRCESRLKAKVAHTENGNDNGDAINKYKVKFGLHCVIIRHYCSAASYNVELDFDLVGRRPLGLGLRVGQSDVRLTGWVGTIFEYYISSR